MAPTPRPERCRCPDSHKRLLPWPLRVETGPCAPVSVGPSVWQSVGATARSCPTCRAQSPACAPQASGIFGCCCRRSSWPGCVLCRHPASRPLSGECFAAQAGGPAGWSPETLSRAESGAVLRWTRDKDLLQPASVFVLLMFTPGLAPSLFFSFSVGKCNPCSQTFLCLQTRSGGVSLRS